MMNRVGQRLGNYRMISLLGEGGFAEVYLGEHMFLGTQAAIKVLQVQLAYDERESFLNEARTIAGLSHPNILRVLEFGVEENVPFLVLEYAPNGTLRQRHPRGSILPLTIILPYVRQIAAALQYLHSRKLIHRDIKPENLLLGPRNEVLLSDFGTALVVQTMHNQSTLEMAGTVTYMAPEQIRGKPRPASDQYGLAVVVYEWLCGIPPFIGSFTELSSQHMFATPPSLRAKVPSIPYDIEQVMVTALAKDPERRFANVLAFANALEQASRPEPWPYNPGNVITPSASAPLAPSFNSFSSQDGKESFMAGRSTSSPDETIASAQRSPSDLLKTPVIQRSERESPTLFAAPFVTQPSVVPAPVFSDSKIQPGRKFSRRFVVAGLLGLGGVLAAGGLSTWLVLSKRGLVSAISSTPTPAKVAPGTTFVTYKGHLRRIYTVAWQPKGQHIASGGADNKVQVWDPISPSGKTLFTYLKHSGSVNALAWSPDGQRIASASADKTVQVWDALTGNNHLIYSHHTDNVRAAAWSPDGQRIASGGDDMIVQVWDASSGNLLVTYRHNSALVWAVSWSPDSQRIASCGADNTVQVWNASSGNTLVTYRGHTAAVKAGAWSPDGQRIASGGDDKLVRVWDAATGKTLVTYTEHSQSVYSVAWSPGGQYIASSSEGEVRVWEPLAPDGRTFNTYSDQPESVHAVTWSPDGQRIASGGDDKTVQVWQAV